MKMTKSWLVTLISFVMALIMPILNDPLSAYGIVITEQELTHFLFVLFGVSGLGVGKSILNKHTERKKQEAIQKPIIPTNKPFIIPTKLKGDWYKTNFVKGSSGNTIPYGAPYLWAQIVGAKTYVTGILKDAKGTVLQIEQGGHPGNPPIDTVRLELIDKSGQPFPRGIYHLQVQGDRGTSDSTGIEDVTFKIV